MKKALGSVKLKPPNPKNNREETEDERIENNFKENLDCPVSKDQLGTASWILLHTLAAYYPDEPTNEDQQKALNLVSSLASFYPCSWCAKDFQKKIVEHPPCVESRECFSKWMCLQHNLVNQKLGKPVFDCSLANLDKRWKKGGPECP
mmetsp:Transcript_32825/g.43198  ORF Transcript_32825/g.43198 Transcript_32825/m.43198 type:complete len:148 (+) Transcript_32825:1-444(+)